MLKIRPYFSIARFFPVIGFVVVRRVTICIRLFMNSCIFLSTLIRFKVQFRVKIMEKLVNEGPFRVFSVFFWIQLI